MAKGGCLHPQAATLGGQALAGYLYDGQGNRLQQVDHTGALPITTNYAVDIAEIVIHHDQDPVYTSYDWTGQLLLRDRLHVSYTLDGAKDNPKMEAFISRFKNENRSLLLDAATIETLEQVVNERMSYYNDIRRHSSLGYLPPRTYLERWLQTAGKKTSDPISVLEDHTKT